MATLTRVDVPDIGDFTDIPITEVFVSVGDKLDPESPIVEIESDKATMEVPSPAAGVVAEVLVAVGDKVSQGTPLIQLEVEGDGDGAAAAAVEAAEAPPSSEAAAPAAIASATTAEVQASGLQTSSDSPQMQPTDGGPIHASPLARRLASDLGVDLASIPGTGRNGRITKNDVLGAGSAPAAATAGLQTSSDSRQTQPTGPQPGERVALTKMQARSAANLAQAWQTIPHVTQHDEADITDLEAFRKQLNAEQSEVKVTMVALLLKACVASLAEYPRLASSLDGDELVYKAERHIGFAADTPNGLVVPVIKDVDRKGLLEIAAELTTLSGKAREGKLSMPEISGAVFTISSLGGIGGTGFTPIVNPPQVAILGVVRSATRPVWDGKEFQPRLMLPLSLSYDHRVIDGALAARFTVHLAKVLTDLRRALL
jgi:pyruvate dehydrogenase E2 component (dihydrolipoamide acetyltransferase)